MPHEGSPLSSYTIVWGLRSVLNVLGPEGCHTASPASPASFAHADLEPLPLQVPHEGNQLSCCAVVQGLQRSVFVVPKPGTFDTDAELEELQARAEGDASLKGPLMKRLHVGRLESPAYNIDVDSGPAQWLARLSARQAVLCGAWGA